MSVFPFKRLTVPAVLAIAMVASGPVHAQPPRGPDPDSNGDGIVTRAEALAAADAQFARMDVTGDGRLSPDDRAAMMAQRSTDAAGPPRGRRGSDRTGGPGGPEGMMRLMDSNQDGAVDRAEWQAAATRRFERADTNHDGNITGAERDAQRAAMRQRFGPPPGGNDDMPPPPGE